MSHRNSIVDESHTAMIIFVACVITLILGYCYRELILTLFNFANTGMSTDGLVDVTP